MYSRWIWHLLKQIALGRRCWWKKIFFTLLFIKYKKLYIMVQFMSYEQFNTIFSDWTNPFTRISFVLFNLIDLINFSDFYDCCIKICWYFIWLIDGCLLTITSSRWFNLFGWVKQKIQFRPFVFGFYQETMENWIFGTFYFWWNYFKFEDSCWNNKKKRKSFPKKLT